MVRMVLGEDDGDGVEVGVSSRKDEQVRTHMKATVTKEGTMTLSEVQPSTLSTRRENCRSCGTGRLSPVLSLGNQFLVNFVPQICMGAPRSPLNLMRCGSCGLLQLEHTVSPDMLYREFWYRSSVNETMRDALEDVVKTGLLFHHSGTWLDIGANDGYLLSKVPPGFTRIACEPALNFREELEKVADHVIAGFFSADHECLYRAHRHDRARGACDVITSAAMFYDLDDPNAFVADIASSLSENGVWINQLNDSPTMLAKNAFDAICHEHLCYYDVHALEALYRRHGLTIIGVTYNDVNGGSIRVVAEKGGYKTRSIVLHEHRQVSERDAEQFALRTAKWKRNMTDLVTGSLAYDKRMWLYGASTKGCALLQYLDLNEAFVGIADRNPRKFGKLMTGSWIPVRPEHEMRAEKPRYVVVLPWAFRNEFVVRETELLESGTTMLFPLPTIEFVG